MEKDKKINMDQLILKAKKNKKIVKVFPVSESQWLDIGQWDEYRKTVKQLESFK